MSDCHIDSFLPLSSVEAVAELANLALTDAEKATFQKELASIVGFADQLSQLPFDATEFEACPPRHTMALRQDMLQASLDKTHVLAMSSCHDGDCITVDQAVL